MFKLQYYCIVGRIIVERGESGYYEVLDYSATSDAVLNPNVAEDAIDLVFNPNMIPEAVGIYALLFAAQIDNFQDHEGEWDAFATIRWSFVAKLNEKEAEAVRDQEYAK